jgi:transposase
LPQLFCGIDWAEDHHDVALVDDTGRVEAQLRIGDDADGYRQLVDLLADHGDTPQDPIPVAIETGRGLLVACLHATGRAVYAINPLAAARYRERHAVSRRKSDADDAIILANILRTDAHAHRPMPANTELAQAITVLARAQQDAVWNRQQMANQLRSHLREYYPAALQAFQHQANGGLTRADARAILAAAPTPSQAAKLTRSQLRAALKRSGRTRDFDTAIDRIQAVFRATICASAHKWKRRWATRRWPCCGSSTQPAQPQTTSPPRRSSSSTTTRMPRSCSVSLVWVR